MPDRSRPRPVGASRREFLCGLAAANGTILAGCARSWAAEPDPRIKQILAKTVTVDMHNHGGIGSNTPPQRSNSAPKGTPKAGDIGSSGRDANIVEAMRRAGDSAICLTYAPDGRLMGVGAGAAAPGTRSNLIRDPNPGEMYQEHRKYEDQIDAMVAKYGIRRVLKYSDLEMGHKEGRPVFIQDSEGADFLEKGNLDWLEEAHKRGLRKLQFVHYAVNDIGDFRTGPVVHQGLSPFGVEAVKECNRLGIVVDTAHGTFDMVKRVIKASSKPAVLSHTSLFGSKAQGTFWAENFRGGLPTMQARQVKPEHAKTVADAGGVVGIWHLFPSAEKYVQGIREMVDVIGADHVGIGMDWAIEGINHIWPDQKEGMMYTVIGEMLKHGFTAEECGKIAGGNFCRVFKACV
ncbi:MAG: hypothetical protein C5B51_30420 [Terriglobia bacterium]|nr:MAG: hypothetical protein C5B51_30420 [Terriglobia bacterium]